MNDHDFAAQVATDAGRLLLDWRRSAQNEELDSATMRDEADRRSNDYILANLTEVFPDDAFLSEESADDKTRLSADRVWIIDPLDGTREFGEMGRSDWAVHVALAVDGQLKVGAVALPAQDITFSTRTPFNLPPRDSAAKPRILVSRTRPPAFAGELCDQLNGEQIPMGSAGAKTMAILQGKADIYAHAGGQYEWDSAAPAAVAQAAGLHVSRLDGTQMLYNQANPWLPDLLICRKEFASQVLEIARDLNS